MKYDFKGKKEGWDFDGTICHSPEGIWLKIYRAIERVFPFVTLLLPPKKLPEKGDIIIITASGNKAGVIAWLKLHKVNYEAVMFVDGWKEKKYFVNKLCKNYMEIE